MEDYLPSEVARLVLGYLKDVNCMKSWHMFLEENPSLHEYFLLYKNGKIYSTNIDQKSLLEILSLYRSLRRYGDKIINEIERCEMEYNSDPDTKKDIFEELANMVSLIFQKYHPINNGNITNASPLSLTTSISPSSTSEVTISGDSNSKSSFINGTSENINQPDSTGTNAFSVVSKDTHQLPNICEVFSLSNLNNSLSLYNKANFNMNEVETDESSVKTVPVTNSSKDHSEKFKVPNVEISEGILKDNCSALNNESQIYYDIGKNLFLCNNRSTDNHDFKSIDGNCVVVPVSCVNAETKQMPTTNVSQSEVKETADKPSKTVLSTADNIDCSDKITTDLRSENRSIESLENVGGSSNNFPQNSLSPNVNSNKNLELNGVLYNKPNIVGEASNLGTKVNYLNNAPGSEIVPSSYQFATLNTFPVSTVPTYILSGDVLMQNAVPYNFLINAPFNEMSLPMSNNSSNNTQNPDYSSNKIQNPDYSSNNTQNPDNFSNNTQNPDNSSNNIQNPDNSSNNTQYPDNTTVDTLVKVENGTLVHPNPFSESSLSVSKKKPNRKNNTAGKKECKNKSGDSVEKLRKERSKNKSKDKQFMKTAELKSSSSGEKESKSKSCNSVKNLSMEKCQNKSKDKQFAAIKVDQLRSILPKTFEYSKQDYSKRYPNGQLLYLFLDTPEKTKEIPVNESCTPLKSDAVVNETEALQLLPLTAIESDQSKTMQTNELEPLSSDKHNRLNKNSKVKLHCLFPDALEMKKKVLNENLITSKCDSNVNKTEMSASQLLSTLANKSKQDKIVKTKRSKSSELIKCKPVPKRKLICLFPDIPERNKEKVLVSETAVISDNNTVVTEIGAPQLSSLITAKNKICRKKVPSPESEVTNELQPLSRKRKRTTNNSNQFYEIQSCHETGNSKTCDELKSNGKLNESLKQTDRNQSIAENNILKDKEKSHKSRKKVSEGSYQAQEIDTKIQSSNNKIKLKENVMTQLNDKNKKPHKQNKSAQECKTVNSSKKVTNKKLSGVQNIPPKDCKKLTTLNKNDKNKKSSKQNKSTQECKTVTSLKKVTNEHSKVQNISSKDCKKLTTLNKNDASKTKKMCQNPHPKPHEKSIIGRKTKSSPSSTKKKMPLQEVSLRKNVIHPIKPDVKIPKSKKCSSDMNGKDKYLKNINKSEKLQDSCSSSSLILSKNLKKSLVKKGDLQQTVCDLSSDLSSVSPFGNKPSKILQCSERDCGLKEAGNFELLSLSPSFELLSNDHESTRINTLINSSEHISQTETHNVSNDCKSKLLLSSFQTQNIAAQSKPIVQSVKQSNLIVNKNSKAAKEITTSNCSKINEINNQVAPRNLTINGSVFSICNLSLDSEIVTNPLNQCKPVNTIFVHNTTEQKSISSYNLHDKIPKICDVSSNNQDLMQNDGGIKIKIEKTSSVCDRLELDSKIDHISNCTLIADAQNCDKLSFSLDARNCDKLSFTPGAQNCDELPFSQDSDLTKDKFCNNEKEQLEEKINLDTKQSFNSPCFSENTMKQQSDSQKNIDSSILMDSKLQSDPCVMLTKLDEHQIQYLTNKSVQNTIEKQTDFRNNFEKIAGTVPEQNNKMLSQSSGESILSYSLKLSIHNFTNSCDNTLKNSVETKIERSDEKEREVSLALTSCEKKLIISQSNNISYSPPVACGDESKLSSEKDSSKNPTITVKQEINKGSEISQWAIIQSAIEKYGVDYILSKVNEYLNC